MTTRPVPHRLHFPPSRREIITSAARGTLPLATSHVCGICRDEGTVPVYDPCGRNHGLCADCLISWVSDFDDDGLSRDFCPYCRAVFCQAERRDDRHIAQRVAEARLAVEARWARMGMDGDDGDENVEEETGDERDGDSNAESDAASAASDVDALVEQLDRFLQGADDDIRRFWWWLRQVLAVILGVRVLAWYGLWAPPNR